MTIGICNLAETILLIVTVKRAVAQSIGTLLQSTKTVILITNASFMKRGSSRTKQSVNIIEVKRMTNGILYFHQQTILIGKGGFVAVAVSHCRYLAIFVIVKEILLSRLLCQAILATLVFLNFAEHASRSLKLLTELFEGIGTTIARFDDHATYLIDMIAHLITKRKTKSIAIIG